MNEEDARRTLLEILQQWLEEHRRDEERDLAEGETLVLSQDHFEEFGGQTTNGRGYTVANGDYLN